MYQNGESFRVGCKHQCTCIDGAVGCGPLCTTDLPLSSPSCPYPRLVRVPGQCCFSVDCHKGAITPLIPPWKTKQHAKGPLDENDDVLGNGNRWEDEQGYKHLTSKMLVCLMFCILKNLFILSPKTLWCFLFCPHMGFFKVHKFYPIVHASGWQ